MRTRFLASLLLGNLILSGGCASNKGTTDIAFFGKLEKEGTKYYVAKSSGDAADNNLSHIIKKEVAKYNVVYEGDEAEGLSEAAFSARAVKAKYIIYPTVTRWKDTKEKRKTFQTNIDFDITIYETATNKKVNKTEFSRECIYRTANFVASECVNLNLWIENVIR